MPEKGKKMPSTAIFFYKKFAGMKKVCIFATEKPLNTIFMAKIRGPFGTGYVKRLGNTVGRKLGGGEYGIFAYQPEVINPRTTKQTDQRAKFNFCVKMAVVFGDEALAGLSNLHYKTLRNAFTARNIANVAMAPFGEPGEVQPEISARALRISAGGVVNPSPEVNAGSDGFVMVTPVTQYGIESNRPDEIVIVAICTNVMTQNGYRAAMARVPYESFVDGQASAEEVKLLVDVGSGETPVGGFNVVVYCYNVKYNVSDVRFRYGGLRAGGTAEEPTFGSTDTLRTLSRGTNFSNTIVRLTTTT